MGRMRVAGVVLGAALVGSVASRGEAEKPLRPTIAVIPKGTTHVFWKSVEAGARAAGEALAADIVWKGPLKENDRAQQIAIVEQFVTEGVSGIVLAPLDDTALQRPVALAGQKRIPVVIIDSALKGEAGKDFVSFVATDNRQGGRMAGRELARLLGDKGRVVLLRYQVGSASTTEREEGFLEVIREKPGLSVLVENRYGGATVGEAKTASLNLLDKLREADGVFCPNESTTFGMLLALRQSRLAGRIRFVGFDTAPHLVEGLRNGEIHALVAQDPFRIGYDGVRMMMERLGGRTPPPAVDTGARLITPANLDDPDVLRLIAAP
jgi:ribose transport system substrate-binding protein